MRNPLGSPKAYQKFIYTLPERYPGLHQSTLVYIPSDTLYGRVEGWLFFDQNLVLCVKEYLNFELGVIEGYGYEVSNPHIPQDSPEFPDSAEYCRADHRNKDKLYWYDSFPHPHILELSSTNPHHKHIPPNIKHNRIPAPELSFTKPNLPFLIEEIGTLLDSL